MTEGISIDLGSLAAYLEDCIRSVFGKDHTTTEWRDRVDRRMRLSLEQAKSIQCVGMDRPVAIEDIYQPIQIVPAGNEWETFRDKKTDIWRLLRAESDAVIFAGPGRGKTTLLNWLYIQLLRSEHYSPFLFLLRLPGVVGELQEFVQRLPKATTSEARRPILLVDGYDEIDENQRRSVSETLLDFQAKRTVGPDKAKRNGNFFLTCRTFYDVYELKVSHYRLAPFSNEDAERFVKAFSTAYEISIDEHDLLLQLETRGLWDFATHPLMLTLICILKSGPLPELPHNSLGLLKRAFDTLTFRWDQQKGVYRRSGVPLDGEDRVRCLMRLAYKMRSLVATQEDVEAYTRQFLRLAQRPNADARQVLQEIAQWYGVLVPAEANKWQFLHRSIHDYLAARFWVESGRFAPAKVRVWNSRAAYAACLSPDSTESIVLALRIVGNIQAFSECLYNKAVFHTGEVAGAVVEHFDTFRPFVHSRAGRWLTVDTNQNFFPLASNAFLEDLLSAAVLNRPRLRDSAEAGRFAAHDVIAAYALAEARRRNLMSKMPWLQGAALEVFGPDEVTVQLGVQSPRLYKIRGGVVR